MWGEERSDLPRKGIADDYDEIRFLPWCTQYHGITNREKSIIVSVLDAHQWNIKKFPRYAKHYHSAYEMLDKVPVKKLVDKARTYTKGAKKGKLRKVKNLPKLIREEMWENYIFLISQAKKIMGEYHFTEGTMDDEFDEMIDINEKEIEAEEIFMEAMKESEDGEKNLEDKEAEDE